jgi:outer membrane protein
MKKLMTLMSVSLLASSLAFAQDTQVAVSTSSSVACIDSQEAMRTSKEGQKVGKELEAKREQLSAQLKKEEAALVKAVEEFKAKSATMSKAEQEAEQQRLMKMERDLKSKVEEAEHELKMAMQKTMEALGKEIEAAVAEVAVKNGLDIVIDTRSGQILYTSDDVVYTNDLVKEMDKNYNAKVAKANTAKKQGTV